MPTQITYNQLLLYAAIFGAIVGLLLGLIPLILGIRKDKTKLGIIGFVTTLIVGIPLSILGAIPAAIVFIWLILRQTPAIDSAQSENSAESKISEL